jgi:aryl-alcohol dehydrogenase-like predicted oxidoreductase
MSFGQWTEHWPWALDEEDSRPLIKRALELGINFFDTANAYSDGTSEVVVGRALRDFASRDEVVRAGKARYIGASSMYAWQFTKALYISDLHGWAGFVSMQPLYNLIYREEEREMLPLCQDQKIGVIPWSPLAAGWLTRKPTAEQEESRRAQTDDIGKSLFKEQDSTIVQRVHEVAETRGMPMAQVALAWVLSKPAVTAPIIGTTKPHHLDDAVAALSIQLTPDEIEQMEEAYAPHIVRGHRQFSVCD